MLIVVSPAKRLDMAPVAGLPMTQPAFQDDANHLVHFARDLTVPDLQRLMGISEKLAKLNTVRFSDFAPTSTPENAKQAALIFAGDTYAGLEAGTLDPDDLRWAQDHLRILSGLYGLLRPLDAIQPYRLEMGSRLQTDRGATLYDYWGDRLSAALNAAAKSAGTDTLINCASVEYFGAVAPEALKLRVITPVFMEERNGQAKIVSFFAKKARGAMARFIIEHRLTGAEAIRDFDTGGYRFNADMSEGDRWVFLRDYPEG
ncbi:peroxide stress protein YaaA [Actibacterium sp. D379-3]